MRWSGRQRAKGKRQEGEAEEWLSVEAALSALARVERAPELSADLRRRIAGTPARRFGWAWVAAVGIMAAGLGLVTMWPREARPLPPRHSQVARGASGGHRPAASLKIASPIVVGEQGHPSEDTDRPAKRLARTWPSSHSRRAVPEGSSSGAGFQPAEGCVSSPDHEGVTAGSAQVAAKDLPAAGPQVENLRHYEEGRQPTEGVILVLGEPEPVLPSGSYYAEVTLADGTRTVREQTVERDAAGRPQAIRISYEQTVAGTAVQQGG